MKERARKIIKHPLISGSIVVSAGSLLANFINFFFNIFLSRNLAVQDYGTIASLIAIINLFGISAGAINPTIVNFTGQKFLNKDFSYIRGIYIKVLKPILLIGLIILLFFVFFNLIISNFLNIANNSILISLTGAIISLSFLGVLNMALFQAKLSFNIFSSLNVLSSSIKLIFSTLFLYLGFGPVGVMVAIFISYAIPYFSGFYFLKFLFKGEVSKVKIDFFEILKYAAPSGAALLALTAINSTDLILVKHIFDPDIAGIYAGLSLIGKVIFFFTAPIGIVMFPILARKHNNNENPGRTIHLSIGLVLASSLSITVFYFLFPEFVISLFLKNSAYLVVAPYLGFFGLFISLYSLCSVMMYYFLSIKKTWIYKPILAVALLQAVLIYLFHATFGVIIFISTSLTLVLLIYLLSYYFFLNKKK